MTTPPLAPADFVRPGTGHGLLDVVRRRYLLSLLVRKEVQVRYRGSVLGWAWSYVKPLVQFLVFFFALGVFLHQNAAVPGYPIYLFSGMIAINFFNEAFANGTRSLVDNAALIKKIYLPREMFPVASTIVAFVNFLPQVVILLGVTVIVGWHPSAAQAVGILLGMLILILLATGLGMIFGAVNVSFRDSQNFVELIALLVTWGSPVLYQWSAVQNAFPAWVTSLYLGNPITSAIELFHAGFWFPTTNGTIPLPSHLILTGIVALAISAVVLLLGQLVFRRVEGRFAQDL